MNKMSGAVSEATNYRWENERYLLNIIKKQLEITDEDMQSPSVVKAKVREAKIEEVLSELAVSETNCINWKRPQPSTCPNEKVSPIFSIPTPFGTFNFGKNKNLK